MFSKKYLILIHPLGHFDEMTFYNAVQRYQTWGKVTEYSYIIASSDKPLDIHNNIANSVPNCRIFITKITSSAAWSNTICSSEWLQKNL